MVKSIAALRKERDKLLKKTESKKVSAAERKVLELEIRALKSPGRREIKRSVKQFGKRVGGFIKKRANIISENLARMEAEERKAKSVKKKRTKLRRRSTTRRTLSR